MPKIKAHKGGRSIRFGLRLTPKAKANWDNVADQHTISQSDVINRILQQDIDDLIAYVDKLTDEGRNDPTA